MEIEIKMPNLSQTTNEVKLLRWLVKEGDKVKKGDALCEVETDKVNMEVESFTDGIVLQLTGKSGQQIKAGSVIAVLDEKCKAVQIGPVLKEKKFEKDEKPLLKSLEKDKEVSEKSSPGIRATKLVKRLAIKHNIDLKNVIGTGPRCTIVKKDLEDYINKKGRTVIIDNEYWDLTPNQQAVSNNLSKSKTSIPHFYLKVEILADNLMEVRNSKKFNKKLSMYSYFIYCSAKILEKFPRLNGYYKDNKIFKNNLINIGFAIASDDELYVPVIKDANRKQLSEIDEEVKWLVAKVQNKKIESADISEGTFTISNLGVYPIDEFYGVINYPQAVLLAIGKIRKVLKVNDDNNISIKSVFNITGSFDHRIANGAQAASFLTGLKKLLEEDRQSYET